MRGRKVRFKYEPCKIPYTYIANYTPDFVIGDIYIEVKGYFKPADRKKMRAVKNSHPDLDIRLWFMQDNYLSNKTKANRYSDWADKNGFPYHVGDTFPKHWFTEEK